MNPRTTFRFLFDELVNVPALRAVRSQGIDVVHILELGLARSPDPEVFKQARDDNRILITRNYQDFAPLVTQAAAHGIQFPGVLFLSTSIPEGNVAAHVRAITEWIQMAGESNPVMNTYGWLNDTSSRE